MEGAARHSLTLITWCQYDSILVHHSLIRTTWCQFCHRSSNAGAAMQEPQCRSSKAGAARQEQRCRSSDAGATCDVQDGLRGWGAGSQQVTLPRGAGLAVSIGRPPCPPPLLSRPGTLFPHSLGYRPLGMSSPWLIHAKLAEPASRVSWIRIVLSN